MPRLIWDDSMAIGLYVIDEQHKELVEIINSIHDALENGGNTTLVSRLIRRFYDYTTSHFVTEESLMDHMTYPFYFQQVREHLDCSMKALDFHRRFAQGGFDLREFLDYIVDWFVKHTTGIDQTLLPHLLERGLIRERAS